MKTKNKPLGATVIRVQGVTHRTLQTLAARIARDGWKSLGIDREDPPTLTAVLDAAVTYFSGNTRPKEESHAR